MFYQDLGIICVFFISLTSCLCSRCLQSLPVSTFLLLWLPASPQCGTAASNCLSCVCIYIYSPVPLCSSPVSHVPRVLSTSGFLVCSCSWLLLLGLFIDLSFLPDPVPACLFIGNLRLFFDWIFACRFLCTFAEDYSRILLLRLCSWILLWSPQTCFTCQYYDLSPA